MSKRKPLPAEAVVVYENGWDKDLTQIEVRLDMAVSQQDHFAEQVRAVVQTWDRIESEYRDKASTVVKIETIDNFSETIPAALIYHVDVSQKVDGQDRFEPTLLEKFAHDLLVYGYEMPESDRDHKRSCAESFALLEQFVSAINATAQDQHKDPKLLTVSKIVIRSRLSPSAITKSVDSHERPGLSSKGR